MYNITTPTTFISGDNPRRNIYYSNLNYSGGNKGPCKEIKTIHGTVILNDKNDKKSGNAQGLPVGYSPPKCVKKYDDAGMCFRFPSNNTSVPLITDGSMYNFQLPPHVKCQYPLDSIKNNTDAKAFTDLYNDTVTKLKSSDVKFNNNDEMNNKIQDLWNEYNPFMKNYCQKISNDFPNPQQSNLTTCVECGNWCAANPNDCNDIKKRICKPEQNPPLNECRCINRTNDSEYKSIINRIHSETC